MVASTERVPPLVRERHEGTETEERRLFYVAITRARDAPYLSRFERRTKNSSPSRFLDDLPGKEIQGDEELPLPVAPEAGAAGTDDGIAVTFSALADYEDCPHGYRLRNLLWFQPQIAQELG